MKNDITNNFMNEYQVAIVIIFLMFDILLYFLWKIF